MNIESIMGAQPALITLDADNAIFERLKQIRDAGFVVVEINQLDPSLFLDLAKAFPELRLGIGNILTPLQLEQAYQVGAHFATSPGFLPSLVQTAQVYSMNYLPSIATCSEAMHAYSLGCEVVRVFPATVSVCTLLDKHIPALRFFPAYVEKGDLPSLLSLPSVAGVCLAPNVNQLREWLQEFRHERLFDVHG